LYIEQLENRVKRLEEALLTVGPIVLEARLNEVLTRLKSQYVPHIDLDTLSVNEERISNVQPAVSALGLLTEPPMQDKHFLAMEEQFAKMNITKGFKGRFYGPSSSHKYFMVRICYSPM